jgi:uncharacterized membrane protein YhaH (DUF805 family)
LKVDWYLKVLKQYAVFSGRARRTEYWMFVLFNILAGIVLGIVDKFAGTDPWLGGIYSLAVLIPGIAVSVRRLHDTDRSGLWFLASLVPCVGAIILLVFMIQEGTRGDNQFGPDPKAT